MTPKAAPSVAPDHLPDPIRRDLAALSDADAARIRELLDLPPWRRGVEAEVLFRAHLSITSRIAILSADREAWSMRQEQRVEEYHRQNGRVPFAEVDATLVDWSPDPALVWTRSREGLLPREAVS